MAGAIDTHDTTDLTASQEDYLEAIYAIGQSRDVVRPKDIIARLKVRGASVTGALHLLAERGLVHHAPYGAVSLTPAGTLAARDITRRHQGLKQFFSETLGVDSRQAEEAACRMEHSISRTILNRLNRLAEFIGACPRYRAASARPADRPAVVTPPDCEGCEIPLPAVPGPPAAVPDAPSRPPTLDQLRPGDRGVVRTIRARTPALRRIAEMGVTAGAPIAVERIAPLGDPIDVRIKGYHLTLRKADAVHITVDPESGGARR